MAKETLTAFDDAGRSTSKAAQSILDEKGNAVSNLATSKEVAKRAAIHVGNFLSRVQMSRTALEDKLTVFYGLWNGDSVADYFPTAHQCHVPEPFKAVEGFVPRAANLLVENPGWFRVVGIDDAGKKNAEIITKLLLAELKRDNFYSKFRSFLRGCAIYGYYPGKVYWKTRRRTIKYNEVVSEPVMTDKETGERHKLKKGKTVEINLDGPTIEPVDIYNFLNDLRYQDLQESPGLAFIQERFEHEVLAMRDSGAYANVDKLISEDQTDGTVAVQGPIGTLSNPASYQDIRNLADGVSNDISRSPKTARIYEIVEFWGLFDKDYDATRHKRGEEKEYVITLGRKLAGNGARGGWIPLRISENPFWHGMRPAVCAHYVRRPHAFQSIGVIEPIVSLSSELDDSRNIGLAARALEAKPMFIASDEADLYSNNFVIDPGAVLRGRTTDAIKAIYIPKVSESAWRSEEVIKADIRETTGIISSYQGSSDAASETATSIVNRQREANKRIAEVAKNMANEFLVPMLEMFHSLNQQMITKEKMVELVGEDGLTVDIQKVSPEEVAGRVNFEITCLPEIEIAGLEARMINDFMTQAMNVAAIDPSATRLVELLKLSWIEQFGTKNLDKIFPSATSPLKFRAAQDEPFIVAMGHNVEVQDGENYMLHLTDHKRVLTTDAFKKWPVDAKRRWMAHIANTESRMAQEMEAQMPNNPIAMQQQQQQMAPPGQEQPQGPGQGMGMGGPPQGMGGGGGRQAQVPQHGPTPGGPQATTTSMVRSAAASNAPRTKKESE